MLTSTDPCKGGLQSLEHFHSLPELNTEVHDGVAIGVNFWVCLWDSWCMILWSFSYDKAFAQLFSYLSPSLCLFPLWTFEAASCSNHCHWPLQDILRQRPRILYAFTSAHTHYTYTDRYHTYTYIHNTNLLVHIIPDQFCLVVFSKCISQCWSHIFVVLMIFQR